MEKKTLIELLESEIEFMDRMMSLSDEEQEIAEIERMNSGDYRQLSEFFKEAVFDDAFE